MTTATPGCSLSQALCKPHRLPHRPRGTEQGFCSPPLPRCTDKETEDRTQHPAEPGHKRPGSLHPGARSTQTGPQEPQRPWNIHLQETQACGVPAVQPDCCGRHQFRDVYHGSRCRLLTERSRARPCTPLGLGSLDCTKGVTRISGGISAIIPRGAPTAGLGTQASPSRGGLAERRPQAARAAAAWGTR